MDAVDMLRRDHCDLERLLPSSIRRLDFNDDRFDERFDVVKLMVRDHIDADESPDGVLDIARARLEAGELMQMAQNIKRVKQTARHDKAA